MKRPAMNRRAMMRRAPRCRAAIGCLVSLALLSTPARAGVEVEPALEAVFFLKALRYENRFEERAADGLVIVLVQDSRKPDEARRSAVQETLVDASTVLKDVRHSVTELDLARGPISEKTLEELEADVLYLLPGVDSSLSWLAELAARRQIITVGSDPDFIDESVCLVVKRRGSRPQALVNRTVAEEQGTAFNARFLKLAELVD